MASRAGLWSDLFRKLVFRSQSLETQVSLIRLKLADVGQLEDFEAAKAKALKIGAEKCYIEDLRKPFIESQCWPAVQCNAVYENVYLLGKLS